MKTKTFLAICLASVGCAFAACGDSETFTKAQACWPSGRVAETNLTVAFRTSFESDGAERPRLTVAGASVFRVLLNGAFCHWGPARTVYGKAIADTVELEAKKGRNTLVIEVGGYNVSSMQYSGEPSFLKAELTQGGRVIAATPRDFIAVQSPRKTTGPVYSRQRGFVAEAYAIDRGWMDWLAGADAARPTLPLEPTAERDYLRRRAALPDFSVSSEFAEGKASDGSTLYTLPTIQSGFLGFTCVCTRPGRVILTFDEALVDGKIDLNRNGDPLKSWHAMLNKLVWDIREPGTYRLTTMEPYTLKYAKLSAESGEFAKLAPLLRLCRNPGTKETSFKSSDPELTRLFAASCKSLEQNAVDLFTDCPSRERVGWLCDTYFTAQAAAYLTGDFGIEQEYLLNFARTDDYGPNIPKGAIPGFMPSRVGGQMPTYMTWYMLQCERAASRLSGAARTEFTEAVRPKVEGIVGHLSKFEKEGLLEDLPGWVFIEWSKANDYVKGVNFPANMLWAKALAQCGAWLGHPEWTERAKGVRAKVAALSFDGKVFHDQALRDKNGALAVRRDAKTEICQYYAFFTDLATPKTHAELWKRIVDTLGPHRTATDDLASADAFIGWMLRVELLARYGCRAELVNSIKAYYGKMAAESGTLWEFADGHDSRCHAFGSNIATLIVNASFGIGAIDWANRTVSLAALADDAPEAELAMPLGGGVRLTAKVRREGGRPIREVKASGGWKISKQGEE